MIDRILPLLNKFVPVGLAAKGLEKISPKIKSFLSGAVAAGYTADQAMDFLRDQFSGPEMDQSGGNLRPDEEAAVNRRNQEEMPGRVARGVGALGAAALGGTASAALTGLGQVASPTGIGQGIRQAQLAQPITQPPAPQAAPTPSPQPQPLAPQQVQGATSAFMNFIQKHPELGNFITKQIQSGLTPIDAALNAKGEKKLKNIIADIESNIGQPLENIIEQLFKMNTGQQNQPAQATQQGQAQANTKANPSDAMMRFAAGLQEYKKLRSGK